MNTRWFLAALLPLPTLTLQWALWPWIDPYAWFLFFGAVYLSARFGGRWAGIVSTLLSTGIVWYFFIPPRFSWAIDNPSHLYAAGLFLCLGYLISDAEERTRRSQRNTDAALAEARTANAKVTQLFRKSQELEELKTQFFANVSHELRTPLTLIMSPLARRLAANGLPEAQRREDEIMMRNARILYRHVSDLLGVAKVESGRMVVEYAHVDIGAVTRAMASQFSSLARERGIDYRVDAPPSLEAEVDGEKVQRIVLNLLSNAFKFTSDAGRIAVRLHEDADHAVIEVQDNGPGVPADLRDAVFERFRQVNVGAHRPMGGTGLGLAIVKDFAELQGGKASVTDAPGGGALFVVRLPLRAPAGAVIASAPSQFDPVLEHQAMDEQLQLPARDAAPPAEARAGVDAPLVLLIEDNVDLNTFIADSLRPYYRVASARDGREGLERAMALQPDLIICDVVMPRLGGDRLVLELRRQPALVDVPIVMLTAKVDDELRVRLLRMGVDDCLDKPFAVEELLARLGGLIEKRRRTRAELQRFEHIVATSGDMLAFLDSQRRFLVANAAYAARFGLTPADLQQRHVEEVVGADNYSVIAPYLDRALNGQVQRFVAAPSFPDGKRVVLDAEYRPFVQNGSVHGVVVSLRDITELKAAEEAQRMQADELARRNAELERFNRATVGRELDMIALKRQVNDLSRQLGQAPPFAMVSPETADRPLPGANP